MSEIDWDGLTKSDKIDLVNDEEKVLTLKNWRVEELEFERGGRKETVKALQFDVVEEDGGEPAVETYSVASKRLIKKLRPIVEEAVKSNVDNIKIGIIKTGEGFDTQYVVRKKD